MTQTIQTSIGEIEYNQEDRITLPRGIPGFEDAQYAIWVSAEEYDPIKWLIIERDFGVALPLLDPFLVVDNYDTTLPEEAVEELAPDSMEELALMCVAHPRENEPPTVNLRSPVVINTQKRIALQVILDDDRLPIRYDWTKQENGVSTE